MGGGWEMRPPLLVPLNDPRSFGWRGIRRTANSPSSVLIQKGVRLCWRSIVEAEALDGGENIVR